MDNLASVVAERGDLAAAELMHHEALAVFRRLGGLFDPDTATALGNLSNIYARRRNFERAEAFRLRALDVHQRTSGLASGETLLDVASLVKIYWESGQDARADTLVNHLLRLGGETPLPVHRNVAEMLRQLLKSAWYEFRLDLAKRIGTRVVELLEATEGPSSPETLDAVHVLGNVHRAGGNREAAENAYHRARLGYEGQQMQYEAALVAIDLSKLYRDAGSYVAAEQVLNAALDYLRRKPVRDDQGIVSALGNLALVYYEAERYKKADDTFAEALSAIDRNPSESSIERSLLLHNRAMLKYHLGDYEFSGHTIQ